MVEKRFTVMKTGLHRNYIKKNGRIMLIDDVVELLNALHEENEQLKQSDTITDLETQIMHLKDENEQLKCENELLRNSLEMRDGKMEKVELE